VRTSLHSDQAGPVTIVRLAHGKANAIDLELLDALAAELERLREAPAVVLTGTGNIFSAGVDLFQVVDGGAEYLDRLLPRGARGRCARPGRRDLEIGCGS